MKTQRRQTYASHIDFDSFTVCMRILILNILQGSLQPKLKGANVWPFNARDKLLQAESVIYDYCTNTAKRKLIKSQLQ